MANVHDTLEGAIGPLAPRSASPRKFVVFHVAAQPYAIALEDVQEILPLAELSRPPSCPAILAGFVNIGAELIPVIRLSRLFDFADSPVGLYTPLILLRAAGTRLALLVDGVSQILTLSDDALSPVSSGHSLNNCVTGVVRREDAPLLLLSPARLLLEKERTCLAALEASELSRLDLMRETVA